MRDAVLSRILTIAGLSVSSLLCAQSRPPYSPPPPATSTLPSSAATTTPAAPSVPLTPAQSPSRRAEISYVNGDLAIAASNSSLNQILREISRLTGIKITGGVSEERVFGKYGPASPSEVFRALLDGTSTNMLFIQATGDKPSELILTARMGGATPPNPDAARFDDNSDDELPPPPPNSPSQPAESQSTPAQRNATPQPIAPPPADNNGGATTTSSPSSDPNQQQSPNGVRTPQQIYEELQRLRQQQQSKPPQ
jgi:hypothetical protein